MARVKILFPGTCLFSTEIPVRITDINYGGHLGNDSVLSVVHEARVQCLRQFGFTEADIDGVGIIMTDAVIVYRHESFYGDVLRIDVAVQDLTRTGCDFVFRLTDKKSGKEIALAKTGVVFFDYEERKVMAVPTAFVEIVKK
ncbi:MAG: thioesterase family protein [candidate division WOR-3 bacterium]|nr:MAG: thioesterase family protein [candidate division WOR-3 bacterium]